MPDTRWKAAERRVGKMCGCPSGNQRVGPVGDTGFDVDPEAAGVEDFTIVDWFKIGEPICPPVHRRLGIEVKSSKALPKWLTGAVQQAKRHSERDTRRKEGIFYDSVVALVPFRGEDKDVLVVLSLEEYLVLRKKAAKEG